RSRARPELGAEAVVPLRVKVARERGVGGARERPVMRHAEEPAPIRAVAEARDQEARGPVPQRRPDEIGRPEERNVTHQERHALEAREILERQPGAPDPEPPCRILAFADLTGGDDAVLEREAARPDLRERRAFQMEAALEVDAAVREDARLLDEGQLEPQALHPRSPLLERHVALGDDGLLLQAAMDASRPELHVLVLDRDEFAGRRIRGEEVLFDERLLPLRPSGVARVDRDTDRPAFLGQLEFRLEPAPLPEVRREGIGVEGGLGRKILRSRADRDGHTHEEPEKLALAVDSLRREEEARRLRPFTLRSNLQALVCAETPHAGRGAASRRPKSPNAFQTSISGTSPLISSGGWVAARISSTETPGARSTRTRPPPFFTSRTARSVMMRGTQPLPARGSVQLFSIFFSPFFATCSIVTTMRRPAARRSIAPPIPFTSFPGIIQFAIDPSASTCIAPKMQRSMWPPRIITKESADEKNAAPGTTVTVSFPALMRSGSTSLSVGYGPMPRMPFSDWRMTSMPFGMKFETSVGMPMPRFTYIPSLSSLAARRMMPSRSSFAILSPSARCAVRCA